MIVGDQLCGLSARNESPTMAYGVTITLDRLAARNSSSCEVVDHWGLLPPPVETLQGPPGFGNGRTYTSKIPPASFEKYAIHRPSDENFGYPSFAGVPRNTVGLPDVQPRAASSYMGRIIRSVPVAPRLAT